jgi:DNA-binding NarL/FixJ family response regulator
VIRVLLVAASPALRAGLRSLLAADPRVEVIGEAMRLADFEENEADIILMSASSSPNLDPSIPVSIPVLLLTDSPISTSAAIRGRPVFGLLPSDSSAEELLAAVHALAEGLVVGPRALLIAEEDASRQRSSGPLTEREQEVLSLLAQGLANKQIAIQLGISEHTVKFHISSIYTKLNATNRAEAIRAGLRGGWIAI